MAAKRTKTSARTRPTVDLEAIGLVVLASGLALLGLIVPALPTGELGAVVQDATSGRIGVFAYALPWPLVALGGAFLLRRNPTGWPRVVFGYLLAWTGVWGVTMVAAPDLAGGWAVRARTGLTGALGAAVAVPALVVATLGIEAMVGWRPLRITHAALLATVRVVRRSWRWATATRRRVKARAAFRADVARVRADLKRVAHDLGVLAELYPASGELARWREQVEALRKRLRQVDAAGLVEARHDADAWRAAVDDFTASRADDLIPHLRAEGVRELEPWLQARRDDLRDAFEGGSRSARALDGVRKALALDLTALETRYRKATRERDQAEVALRDASADDLARVGRTHAQRRNAYKEIAAAAETIDADIERLEAWRALDGDLLRLLDAHGEVDEVHELDRALAGDLKERGREVLAKEDAWREALQAVEARAEEAARRARDEARAEAEAVAAEEARAAAEARRRVMAGEDPDEPALLGPGDVSAATDGEMGDGVSTDDRSDGRADDRSVEASPGDPTAVDPTAADPTPPFDATARSANARGATSTSTSTATSERPPRGAPTATREADDLPEVGGIPIQIPPLDLLDPLPPSGEDPRAQAREVAARVKRIDETLANFHLQGRVVSSVRGPTVTRFEVEPAPGEKIARFSNLADDLALAMAASSVRIEAPIPGKGVIGLEVANADRDLIRFREAVASPAFVKARARLPLILGKSIDGEMVVADLARMPHLLIAGSTGSGKSVAVNTLIASLTYKFLPTELRFLMIDPKMVELTPYDGVPHLIRPVVTNPSDAAGVLLGAVAHMERRYKMMSRIGAKNLDQYNEKARNLDLPHLPFVAIVIDELADLMITSPKEVESAIMRLAQMARATGMHLVLATQRPSVDILTSLIKVNVPARVAFAVSSGHDSRTILDTMGAERLVGLGDMLFYQPGMVKPARLQGPYVSEDEIAAVAAFLRRQYFDDEFVEAYGDDFEPVSADDSDASGLVDWNDDKLRVAAEMVIHEGQASVSRLQRRLQVGHARAGKLMDSLEGLGVVGSHVGSKPRDVLVALEELPDIFGR
ncbi:MAG: DNA translocase FtsK [Trueperaceae bacterium]